MQQQVTPLPHMAPLPEAFHEFYDPKNQFHGDRSDLLGWLYESRYDEQVTVCSPAGERQLTVREQLAVELGHLSLLRRDTTRECTGLGLEEAGLLDAVATAEYGTERAVDHVQRTVRRLKQRPDVERRFDKLYSHEEIEGAGLLLAGMVVAAVAHRGQQRLNGEAFYTHPVSVATILGIAARGLDDCKAKLSPLQLRLLQYRALNHDSFEDRIAEKADNGTSFLSGENLLASPLLHQRLLERYVSKGDAVLVANDVYLLTKLRGYGGTMENEAYMDRLHGHIAAELVKIADTTHNRYIDPKEKPITNPDKVQEWQRTRLKYERNLQLLLRNIRRDPAATLFDTSLASRIPTVKKSRLAPFRRNRLLNQLTSDVILAEYDAAASGAA